MEQEERIIELEIKLSEVTKLSEELSDIIAKQANRLDIDERRIQLLMARAAQDEADSAKGITINDNIPHHG